MTRGQRILAIALALQLALLVALRWLGGAGGAPARAPLLPDFRAEQAMRIEVSARDAKPLVVEKGAAGWGLAGFGGYPADTAKVGSVLRRLAAARIGTPVVEGSRYHATLHVAEGESERRVRVWQAGREEPVVDLLLGSSAQSDLVYARRSGDDRVYEVDDLPSYEVRPEAAAWIEGRFFEFPVERVTAFALTNEAGSFRAVREPQGWRVAEPRSWAGRRLDAGKVEAFLRNVSSIYAVEPIGLATEGALLEGLLSIELTGETPGAASETRELRVGEALPGEAQERSVSRSGFPYAAAVHENSVHPVLQGRAADLLP